MELNYEGRREFDKDPVKFLVTVRDLCWTNNLPVYWRDEEDVKSVSYISNVSDKGILLEWNKDNDKDPFILDSNDNIFSPSRDCPDIEECVKRFFELNELYKFDKEFDRNVILEHKMANFAIKTKINEINEFLVKDRLSVNNYLSDAKVQVYTKSVLINSFEEVIELMRSDESSRELADLVERFLKGKYKPGIENALLNLDTSKECYINASKIASK